MERIKEEKIEIPIKDDGISLKGSIYYSSRTPLSAPFILNIAGLRDDRNSYFVKFYTEKFANAGYYVLCYDHRAHGETAKQTGKNFFKQMKKIFTDIKPVVSWVLDSQEHRNREKQIALFGRSLGGAIILTNGFLDKRVQVLIALCTRYDYATLNSQNLSFGDELNSVMSPKYFLEQDPTNNDRVLIAHCEDDERIPFKQVSQIQEQLGLSNHNVITYKTGGHSFKGHREDVFEHSIQFLNKKSNQLFFPTTLQIEVLI